MSHLSLFEVYPRVFFPFCLSLFLSRLIHPFIIIILGGHAIQSQQHTEIIIAEIRRLQNCIAHLVRSNRELQEALAEGPDPDFTQAIEENVLVIAVSIIVCDACACVRV